MSAAFITASASNLLTPAPAELVSLTVKSADGACVIYLRDGSGSGAMALHVSTTAANETIVFCPSVPILFNKGIFLTIVSGTSVVVCIAYI